MNFISDPQGNYVVNVPSMVSCLGMSIISVIQIIYAVLAYRMAANVKPGAWWAGMFCLATGLLGTYINIHKDLN